MHTWDELNNFILHCRGCGLARTRRLPVVGQGNRRTDLMMIAEAPGAREDEEGVPFVGPAGKDAGSAPRRCRTQPRGDLSDQYRKNATRPATGIRGRRKRISVCPISAMKLICCVRKSSSVSAGSPHSASSLWITASPGSTAHGSDGKTAISPPYTTRPLF